MEAGTFSAEDYANFAVLRECLATVVAHIANSVSQHWDEWSTGTIRTAFGASTLGLGVIALGEAIPKRVVVRVTTGEKRKNMSRGEMVPEIISVILHLEKVDGEPRRARVTEMTVTNQPVVTRRRSRGSEDEEILRTVNDIAKCGGAVVPEKGCFVA